MHAFPSGIQPYRPPQSVKDSHISKITSCDETIAALSSNGEVFTFSTPPPNQSTSSHAESSSFELQNRNTKPATFKPQRVWALRKKFSSVKDVALGSDGSIIVCTESGHVFLRTRNAISSSSANINGIKSGTAASGKISKFERIPFLQRVTRVCANSTGAYGALRVDWEPRPIDLTGDGVDMTLKDVQPYLEFYRGEVEAHADVAMEIPGTGRKARRRSFDGDQVLASSLLLHDDDIEDDIGVRDDITGILELCRILRCEQHMRKAGGGSVQYHREDGKPVPLPNGADTMVYVQPYGVVFPVHRFVLAARSDVFKSLFCGLKTEDRMEKVNLGERSVSGQEKGKGKEDGPSLRVNLRLLPSKPGSGNGILKLTRLSIDGCHPMTILIFFWYIYSDELLAIWDRRVGGAEVVEKNLVKFEISPARVKQELQALAAVLRLPSLSAALEPPVKRAPSPSMRRDMGKVFDLVQHKDGETQGVLKAKLLPLSSPLVPDVVLELADKDVYCHSVILRARSPFFASFFGLEDWTVKRWNAEGMIRVNMRHFNWHVMQYVLRFMCCGDGIEMFHTLGTHRLLSSSALINWSFSPVDFVDSVEDLIEFMFEVLAGAVSDDDLL
jgi:hypothetical protein